MIESPLLPSFASVADNALEVVNPATGEVLARLPSAGADETLTALEVAQSALQQEYSRETRRAWLTHIFRLLIENRDELARIITLENSKPLNEAKVEVEYSAGFFAFFATQIELLKTEDLGEIKNLHWRVHQRPAGVVGLITPWNFPLAMLAKKLAPALATGCSAVIKPAELTPLSALALIEIAKRAGVPQNRAQCVIGEPSVIGEVLCSHPAVRVISFTGSTEVGRVLIRNSAPYIKRLSLELGGNAPFIVFEDGDIETAAEALITNKFRCAGQTCVCANRVYVAHAIADHFVEAVVTRVKKLRVGNGFEDGVQIGPLINRAAWDKVSLHLEDALLKGARKVFGENCERPPQDWGAYFHPTVITGVTSEMLVAQQETFGPVVSVSTFDGEGEVIAAANSTPYGLAAYVFTDSTERIDRIATQLKFGHVGINTGQGPTPEAPFGGMKQSGFGREGGQEGLFEFCESQATATFESASETVTQ